MDLFRKLIPWKNVSYLSDKQNYDKTKIAIRMEYINATNEHYLDNIAKYCDFLEFKLIKYEKYSTA